MYTILNNLNEKSPNRNNAVFRVPKFWGKYILDNVKKSTPVFKHSIISVRGLYIDFIPNPPTKIVIKPKPIFLPKA